MKGLLVECGEALHGARWQAPLARDLNVSDRTIRQWVAPSSSTDIPPSVYLDLFFLCVARSAEIDVLVVRLKAQLQMPPEIV